MVRMYICTFCAYSTQRKDAYIRHQSSKKHEKNIMRNSHHNSENVIHVSENVIHDSENVIHVSENVIHDSENVIHDSENVIHVSENVAIGNYICRKCNKNYMKKDCFLNHEKNCTGVDSLTCPVCMKRFAHRHAKSKHCKRNNCKPVSIFEAENVKSIINNNQSYNNNLTNSLNTNINNNVTNVYINDYGKERKDYLLSYDNFFDIIRRPNNNILVKYLKCKNFNPLFPENHCIKYENRCFKLKENNNWRLINPNALKDKLYYDCGSEVFNAFSNNEERIRGHIQNNDHFDAVKKKSDFMQLEISGDDRDIKNSMLDIVKDT